VSVSNSTAGLGKPAEAHSLLMLQDLNHQLHQQVYELHLVAKLELLRQQQQQQIPHWLPTSRDGHLCLLEYTTKPEVPPPGTNQGVSVRG